jgi:MFS family permease
VKGWNPFISRQDAPSRYPLGCIASPGALPRERFRSLTLNGPRAIAPCDVSDRQAARLDTPSSIAATVEASKPNRRGLNLGIQQAALPLFGLGLAPLIATQLLAVMSWRWVFAVVSLPGFIVAVGMYMVLRKDAPEDSPAAASSADPRDHQWTHVFRYRNVSLAILGQLA